MPERDIIQTRISRELSCTECGISRHTQEHAPTMVTTNGRGFMCIECADEIWWNKNRFYYGFDGKETWKLFKITTIDGDYFTEYAHVSKDSN